MAMTIVVLYKSYLIFKESKECLIENRPIIIKGNSMSELFKSGQETQAQFGYYDCHDVQREDTILLKQMNHSEVLIKKVLMLPEDNFYLRGYGKGSHLIVNNSVLLTPKGHPYFFSHEAERVLRYYEANFANTVPNAHYFVFGTKPDGSTDSSSFGPISKLEILARVQN